ncbi:type IX secretion system sortase PorU [uncultured Tenacibaculum sp.]|uniref:type IX secretion system sortase PorU n=1 Tax=uncultured Tenacibaculum sp. TaxID=174713 RepID=UPI00260AE13F|nr:type IX secretion system sortase PorU [uncultured Tenacibaculum sp.]
MIKKSLLILIFCTVCLFGQTRNSVLASGEWYKFSIDATGVFKIDANFLSSLGININSVNPKNIKIYGNGGKLLPELASEFRYTDLQENSIFVRGEDDNQFNGDDFILFYGVGPHSWDVDATNETANHVQNIYTDKAYYFINISNNPGKRIVNAPTVTNSSSLNITEYDDFIFYEQEDTNILAVGRLWFGENFSINSDQDFSLKFDNAVLGSDALIRVTAVAQSSTTSNMNIAINGNSIPTITFPPVANSSSSGLARYGTSSGNVDVANDLSVNITYNNNGNPSANAFLDFIEVIGKKQLTVGDKQFNFRSFNQANATNVVSFQIQNSNNISQLWDVTDPLNPSVISNEDSTSNIFSFKALGGNLNEYVVLNENDYFSPERINNSTVRNQNLQGLTDIEYIVITSNELINQAQRLADYHQENSNLNTKVINVLDIYNEFSSGAPDIVGIRDFIKYLYDNSTRKLKYVCFFGDSSYDFKDRITGNNNVVPTFHAEESFDLVASYVTDDFFVMIDDSDGTMRAVDNIDITSGRIPVTTTQEASNVVDKILSYYQSDSFGDWRNNIALIADDIDENSDRTLQSGLEEVADSIKKYKPILNINKIYADAFKQENSSGGERYPDVKNAITNAMEKGVLAFDYFGHGGEDGLALERILEIPQIQGFNNFNTLPLFITVTCEFSRFDNPLRDTAGEQLFLNPNGGAVSMITTTRDVFIFLGETFNKELAKYVFDFDNSDDSIAANLIKTKNETSSNQRFFIYFFGDPAMKLAIPKPDVRITKVNDVDITQPIDALKALSRIKLEGIVSDNIGNPLTNFNGIVFTTIFDKPIDKTTLDNDGFGIVNTFDSQESKIFRGKSSVENGRFEFEFIVPKDIKITDGKGKISLYAQSENEDKSGVNFDVTVGGINENAPEDTTGPELRAFMNDESFIDGGTTNSSPNLIIKLSDISGINTSITAVDHDIVAVLDGNESEPFILNDFYETELNDFTQGEVNFKFRDLSIGTHTLKIKAWDTYNNSSEITLSFEVISDTTLSLENVLNYPNPFTNYTEFWFNHNKPNEPLEVQVQIFTVSGKLVKTINQTVQTSGGLSRSITWNGLDDFGNKIGKGVYIYKIKVTSSVNNLTSEKYEKLVILQ